MTGGVSSCGKRILLPESVALVVQPATIIPGSTSDAEWVGWDVGVSISREPRGDTAMGRIQFILGMAVGVALFLAGTERGWSADDALRQQVLRLNDITGKDAINGTI